MKKGRFICFLCLVLVVVLVCRHVSSCKQAPKQQQDTAAVVAQAQALIDKGEYEAAYRLLMTVPNIHKNAAAIALKGHFYPKPTEIHTVYPDGRWQKITCDYASDGRYRLYDRYDSIGEWERETWVYTDNGRNYTHRYTDHLNRWEREECIYSGEGWLLYSSYADYTGQALSHTYTYTEKGCLVQSEGSGGCHSHGGRRPAPHLDRFQTTPTYTLNAAGQVVFDGTFTYVYDEAGYLTEKTDGHAVYSYTYDKNGLLQTETLTDGGKITVKTYEKGFLVAKEFRMGVVIQRLTYENDSCGNPIKIVSYDGNDRVEWEETCTWRLFYLPQGYPTQEIWVDIETMQ